MKIYNSTLLSGKATALFVAAIMLIGTGQLGAQTAVSNLGQVSGGFANIGTQAGGAETLRRAYSFTTGSTASTFSGFTMNFLNGSGSPGALSVGLYSAFDAGTVAGGSGTFTNLTLTSGNPLSAGNTVFSGSASLLAGTTYYVMLSSATAPAGSVYTYSPTSSNNEDSGGLAGWTIGVDYVSNNNGAWTSPSALAHFSIQASAIPEPSTYAAIAGAAMLGLAGWHRRRRSTSVATLGVDAAA